MQATLDQLKAMRSKNAAAVAKDRGVPAETVIGVSTGDIRKLAKTMGKDRERAEALWRQPFLETKALAILTLPLETADPDLISNWVTDLPDWSTCDMFAKTIIIPRADAIEWAAKWAASSDLYTKRAGLASIANFCMRSVSIDAEAASAIRTIIEDAADDERDHIRQASCWALREFGKSNADSHDQACLIALELIECGHAARAWVGRCAYRELETLIKIPERRRLISRNSKTAGKYVD